MTSLPSAALAALEFYDNHYCYAEPILLKPDQKLTLGCARYPRHCRFCGKDEPAVTFKGKAHALPTAFGNPGLLSNYECDACNHFFGEGIENHLGNWTKPMRTLSRIKGRSDVPTIKSPGPEKVWRVEHMGPGFRLQEYVKEEYEPFFELDAKAKRLRFELPRDTYTPVAALKGLVKIDLTLIPEAETQNFRETYDWIRDTDHSRKFVDALPVIHTFIPGPMPNDVIALTLMRRRSGIDTVPYAFFTLGFGNHVLQVFLPSASQDKCIDGKLLSFPPFPMPAGNDPARYGLPVVRCEELTASHSVKGDSVPVKFGFHSIASLLDPPWEGS